MYQTNFIHKTPSAEILVDVTIIAAESCRLAAYENKRGFEKRCESCPAYGQKWSCPPYSPSFSSFNTGEYPNAVLVLFRCELDQFSYTKTEYIRIRAANTILKSRMDRFMRSLENSLGGVTLSNGSCRLCNPCGKKKGQPCKRPDKMRFSMEALGLDVGGITADFFGHELLWYKDKKVPAYRSAASCLLMKERIEENAIEEIAGAIL